MDAKTIQDQLNNKYNKVSNLNLHDNGITINQNDGGYMICTSNDIWRFHANQGAAWIHRFNTTGNTILKYFTFSGDGNFTDGLGNVLSNKINKSDAVASYDGDYYRVSGLFTFKDTNNALLSGTKGNFIVGLTSISDKRVKKNINDSVVNALDKINQIKLHEFDFTDKKYGTHKDIGFIAQELKEIIPESVVNVPQDKEKIDFDELYQIDDVQLIPYLVKAIQELYEIVKTLLN